MDLQHEFPCSLCFFGNFIVNEQGKYELMPPLLPCSSGDLTANPPALNESRLVLLKQFWVLFEAKESAYIFGSVQKNSMMEPDAPFLETNSRPARLVSD